MKLNIQIKWFLVPNNLSVSATGTNGDSVQYLSKERNEADFKSWNIFDLLGYNDFAEML